MCSTGILVPYQISLGHIKEYQIESSRTNSTYGRQIKGARSSAMHERRTKRQCASTQALHLDASNLDDYQAFEFFAQVIA